MGEGTGDLPDRAEEKRVDVPQNDAPVETPTTTEATVTETKTEVSETPQNLSGSSSESE